MADSSSRHWNPDLKEYPVELTLDSTPADLKPGIGVQAEIFIDRLQSVVAVPVAAIYSAGPDAYVFVRDGSERRPVRVEIGQNNETHVQIVRGVQPGHEVLMLESGQGRELLEHAGIRIRPRTEDDPAVALAE